MNVLIRTHLKIVFYLIPLFSRHSREGGNLCFPRLSVDPRSFAGVTDFKRNYYFEIGSCNDNDL